MSKYRIIDADAHFIEPESMWPEYLEPAFRGAAPRTVSDSMGRKFTMIAEHLDPRPFDWSKFKDTPASRIAAMDAEGFDAMMLYPTMGLLFACLDRSQSATVAALCRAFNNWAYDYCKADPSRLMFPALVPQISVEETVREARRGVTQLNCKGVFLRPNPVGGMTFEHPAWEPLWDLLEELDTPLVLHEGSSGTMQRVGTDRFENPVFVHAISHPAEHMMALLGLVGSGVLERHPGMRVVHVEAGCGWLPYWMERMDHHAYKSGAGEVPRLKLKPSDYVRRQVLVSADPEENILPSLVSAIGDDNIAFSTDYPHPDHDFEGMARKCIETKGLGEESKRKILGGNVARFFRV